MTKQWQAARQSIRPKVFNWSTSTLVLTLHGDKPACFFSGDLSSLSWSPERHLYQNLLELLDALPVTQPTVSKH